MTRQEKKRGALWGGIRKARIGHRNGLGGRREALLDSSEKGNLRLRGTRGTRGGVRVFSQTGGILWEKGGLKQNLEVVNQKSGESLKKK